MASLLLRGRKYSCRIYVHGRRRSIPLKTSDPQVARDRMRYIEARYQENPFPCDPGIAEALAVYREHLVARRRSKSAQSDIGRLRLFFGAVPVKTLSELTPRMIHDHMVRLVAGGRTQRTGNEYRIAVHGLYSFAGRYLGYRPLWPVPQNPAALVEKFRLSAPRIVFLSREEVEHQLAVLKDRPVMQALVAVAILAGLRRAELLWLTREDVLLDGERPCILVRAKEVGGRSWQPKTSANRSVPVSPSLMLVLRRHLRMLPRSGRWVFPGPGGGRWEESNFSREFRAFQDGAGLSWNLLQFRHTFATQLVRSGVSLYRVAALMGNGPEICRRHYASMSTDVSPEAMEFLRPGAAGVPAGVGLPAFRLVGAGAGAGVRA